MPDDIVGAFARTLETLGHSRDEARRIEYEYRQQWGGSRLYVAKAPVEGKVFRLSVAIAAGRSLKEAMEAAGCKHSQGYAYLRMRVR
jgi:hypothetical protein